MSIKNYRKRPITIQALRWDVANIEEMGQFLGGPVLGRAYDNTLLIKTFEGNMIASPGDYIIKGIKGEFYPCKPDIFEATYEEV